MTLSFVMALRSIGANKLRAVLTMLGIIIGVMALVVLVSLVSGATASVTKAVAGLGSSMLTVSIADDHGSSVNLDTIDKWMNTQRGLGKISPYAIDGAMARYDRTTEAVSVCGTTVDYYEIQALQLSIGRWITRADLDNHSYVCVLNETAAVELILPPSFSLPLAIIVMTPPLLRLLPSRFSASPHSVPLYSVWLPLTVI